jgi:hypothetical protein
MAGENVAVTLVGYKVDTGSVTRAVQANKQVEASIRSVGAASAGNALRFNSIAEAQAALGLSAAQLGVTQTAVTSELQRQLPLAERLAEAAKVRASAESGTAAGLRADAFSGGGRDNRAFQRQLFNARQAAIALPGVGYQSPLTVGIRGLELVANRTGASVGQLAGFVGVLGVALVGVGLAFVEVTKTIEAAKKTLTGALAAQDAYYKALAENTSQQVASQLDELKDRRDLLAQQRTETRNALDSAFAQAQAAFGDAPARALDAGGQLPTAQLREQLAELDAQFAETDGTITRLQQGLEANVFATNDARAAYEALSESQVESANLILSANKLTEEEREERIRAAQIEIDILRGLTEAEGTTYAARQELQAQQNELYQEIDALTRVTDSYADQLEREAAAKQAVTDAYDNYNELLDQEADAREDLADVQAKVGDLVLKREEDIADLREDIADRTEQREEDLGERRAEIAEDNADKIAKIERDFGRSHRDAVRNRNVVADIQARERAADALADQNAAGKKQLENIEKQADKATRVEADGMEKRISRLIRDSQRQIDAENQKARQLEFLIGQSHQSQQFLTVNGFNAINNTWAQGMNNLVVLTNQAFNSMSGNRLTGGGSQNFPTLTDSPEGRALDARMARVATRAVNTRLRQVWE